MRLRPSSVTGGLGLAGALPDLAPALDDVPALVLVLVMPVPPTGSVSDAG